MPFHFMQTWLDYNVLYFNIFNIYPLYNMSFYPVFKIFSLLSFLRGLNIMSCSFVLFYDYCFGLFCLEFSKPLWYYDFQTFYWLWEVYVVILANMYFCSPVLTLSQNYTFDTNLIFSHRSCVIWFLKAKFYWFPLFGKFLSACF